MLVSFLRARLLHVLGLVLRLLGLKKWKIWEKMNDGSWYGTFYFGPLRASWHFLSTGRSRLGFVSTFGIHFSLFLSRFSLEGDEEDLSDYSSPQTRSCRLVRKTRPFCCLHGRHPSILLRFQTKRYAFLFHWRSVECQLRWYD